MIARNNCSRSNEMSAHHRVKSPLTISEMRIGSQSVGFSHRQGFDFLPWMLRPGETEGMIYPIAAALVLYGCLMSVPVSRLLQLSPVLFLGRISFGMYLIHVPVLYTMVMAVAVLLWPMSPITLSIGLVLFAALSVSLGWLMTLAVDEPALRLLSSIRKLTIRPVREPSSNSPNLTLNS